MSKEPTTIEICTYCVQYFANHDVVDSDGNDLTEIHGRLIAAIWADTHITLGCSCCDADADTWFAWRACEGCDSQFGGDRMHATAWIKGGEPDD